MTAGDDSSTGFLRRRRRYEKRGKSLKWSIMILCAVVVAVTAVSIGLNAVMSIRELSAASYNTYEKAMLDGYKLEIRSQVQSTLSIVQGEYDKFKAGEKTEEQALLWLPVR
jgi:hypothetical protein